MREIAIETESIQLDQLLKWADIVQSGGEAKMMIQSGIVLVNGQQELRRSHKVIPGDRIVVQGIDEILIVPGT